jgi:hypothetical protein
MSSQVDKKQVRHVECPYCNTVVKWRTMLDVTKLEFEQSLKQHKLEPEKVWGSPSDDRAIFRDCIQGGWVHFRIERQHRLVYLRGKV